MKRNKKENFEKWISWFFLSHQFHGVISNHLFSFFSSLGIFFQSLWDSNSFHAIFSLSSYIWPSTLTRHLIFPNITLPYNYRFQFSQDVIAVVLIDVFVTHDYHHKHFPLRAASVIITDRFTTKHEINQWQCITPPVTVRGKCLFLMYVRPASSDW